jgi:protein SCO1
MRRLMHLFLLSAVVLLAGCGYEYRGTILEPPSPAPAIELIDQYGQPFRLADHRGEVVLLYFGFTLCPDICPTSLTDIVAAMRELGDAADDIQMALITVDPERDTPQLLQQYMAAFHPDFLGLSGSTEQLSEVYRTYGVTAIRRELPDSALGYTVDHSGYIYAIDRAGEWRLIWAHGTPVADLVSDLRALLRDPAEG